MRKLVNSPPSPCGSKAVIALRRRAAPEGGEDPGVRTYSSPACLMHELPAGVRVRRVYDAAAADDGDRVLVDRFWPPGLSRRSAAIDEWLRELAPSTLLRRWFGHDPRRWSEFRRRYRAELGEHRALLESLLLRATRERVTLLTASREPDCSHAAVLREILDG